MKFIAAMNMTIDGFCNHELGIASEELHSHYTELLKTASVALYGRITYQLMEYWRGVIEKPTGEKTMDDFAMEIDRIPKVVFSHTLHELTWKTARLSKYPVEQEVLKFKNQANGIGLICSPSLIVQLTNLKLIDEYQLCIHPVIAGNGLALFKDVMDKSNLKYLSSKSLDSGAIVHYYQPTI